MVDTLAGLGMARTPPPRKSSATEFPSLRSVARSLGVSVTSVWQVAHNPQTNKVGAELSRRIRAGLGCCDGGDLEVGVCLPQDIARAGGPWAADVLLGLILAAGTSGAMLVVAGAEHWRRPQWRRSVQGLIRLADATPLSRPGLPCVCIGSRQPGQDAVVPDHVEGMAKAVAALHALGHRRIAFVACHDDPHGAPALVERLAGWRSAMRAIGVANPDPLACLIPASGPTAQRAGGAFRVLARRWRGDAARPTAAIAFNDLQASTLRSACAAEGLPCPQAISLIGFDGWKQFADLSSVCIDYLAAGQGALELLRRRLSGPVSPTEQIIRLPCRLVLKGSVGPPPPGSEESPNRIPGHALLATMCKR